MVFNATFNNISVISWWYTMLLNNLPRIAFYVVLILIYNIIISNVIFLCSGEIRIFKTIWSGETPCVHSVIILTFCFLVRIFHFLDIIKHKYELNLKKLLHWNIVVNIKIAIPLYFTVAISCIDDIKRTSIYKICPANLVYEIY